MPYFLRVPDHMANNVIFFWECHETIWQKMSYFLRVPDHMAKNVIFSKKVPDHMAKNVIFPESARPYGKKCHIYWKCQTIWQKMSYFLRVPWDHMAKNVIFSESARPYGKKSVCLIPGTTRGKLLSKYRTPTSPSR